MRAGQGTPSGKAVRACKAQCVKPARLGFFCALHLPLQGAALAAGNATDL